MKHILSIDEAAMMRDSTKKQMKKLQKKAGASGGSKKSSKDKTVGTALTGKIDTYDPANESLVRAKSKKQFQDLNRIIKRAGGDIQDRVRRDEKRKENKMPNSYYMDNPFDSNREVETQEHFMDVTSYQKSVPMKSKDPKNIKRLNKNTLKESIDGSLRTMNAHFQTYIFPNLTIEEQDTIEKLDTILFKYNYDNEVGVRLSFKTPENREDVYQLIIVNVTYPIYKDMVKIVEKLGLVSDYDNKNKLYLNIYYKNKKQNRMNTNRRINEGSYSDFLMNYGQEIKEAIKKLREMDKLFDTITDWEGYEKDITRAMRNYDTNVGDTIDHWISHSSDVDADEIAKFVIQNQNSFGTEPQMVLYAIDDFYKTFMDFVETESQEEEIMEGKRDKSEAEPSDDLKANFRSWEMDCDDEDSAEELSGILQDRHPSYDPEVLRKMAYDWVGCDYVKESLNEAKKTNKKDGFIPPFKKLKNLKHFYEIAYDGDSTEKSNTNDDSWIKGTEDDFKRPMFKNLPDPITRPNYDPLRSGKMINLFGRECRVVGVRNGELTVQVMGKDDKFETEKYDMNDVMKEIKKNTKTEKKSKK